MQPRQMSRNAGAGEGQALTSAGLASRQKSLLLPAESQGKGDPTWWQFSLLGLTSLTPPPHLPKLPPITFPVD